MKTVTLAMQNEHAHEFVNSTSAKMVVYLKAAGLERIKTSFSFEGWGETTTT